MEVGPVTLLARYPVKSLRGEELDSVAVGERGLHGDRGWAVYTPDGGIGSGKTTRRFRRVAGLLDHASTLDAEDGPLVTLASGARHRCGEPGTDAALGAALGRPLTLRPETDVRHHDESPVHVVTTASLRYVERLLGAPVDVHRLRPNMVLDVAGSDPAEDGWIGRDLRVGGVVLTLGPRMPRCVMVDLPQPGVSTDVPMLRTLGRLTGTCLGIQASVRTPGVIRQGDVARLL